MTRLVIAALIVSILAFSCGGDSTDDVPRTIDVDSLTFEDVQRRALAATERPGEVFHITATSGDLTEAPANAWVDRERNLGRAESSRGIFAPLAVYHDDRVAALSPSGNGRFVDAAITSGVPAGAFSVHALGYLAPLFAQDYEYVRRELRAGTHDGAPVIIAEIETEVYESNDTVVTETFLDESFLPVKVERRRNGRRESVTYEHEFIARDALPADFFAVEHVRALEVTPADDIRKAHDAGFNPYWLGEQFEEMVLRDETRFELSPAIAGEFELRLSYGPRGQGPVPVPCASISQYSAEVSAHYDSAESRAQDVELATLQLPGAVATIFERPTGPIPNAPFAGPTPDLPDVPNDTGRHLIAIVELDSGGVINVTPNCGPVGSNLYRTLDAFERLIAALRPYDGP